MNKFNQPYLKNQGRYFTPVYLPGEEYSFYCNFDSLLSDAEPNPRFWELWVIDTLGNQIVKIGPIFRCITTGSITGFVLFHPYFLFPRIKQGEYYFQVWDSMTAEEMCRSNIILCNSDCLDTTTPVKFSHNDQLFGVRYDLLQDLSPYGFEGKFYQRFRVPINQINSIEVSSDRDQYRESANGRDLRNSKSFRDIKNTLEFYWADDEDFEAVSAMLEHDEIYISGNKIMDISQIKVEKPTHVSALSKGTFTVIVNDYGIDYDSLEHWADFILWGGDGNVEINTFVQG